MIISDRHSNRPSLDPLRGGDLLLPQHLPWFLRHPEVHISILPAFGLISEMISKFSQCIISGRDSMLIALLITAVSGCRKGEYRGKCFELCGQGHLSMIINSLVLIFY